LELIHPLAQSYAESYSSQEDELLQQVSDFTFRHHPEPHMLSGHLQGKVLQMISHMIEPKRILEIGTLTGYSAICLASGLSEDGELHTIELREQDAVKAKEFFELSGYSKKIVLHTGKANEIIPSLKESWDLVFIDADKPGYLEYFNQVLPQVRQNGFILADNIFFHGQVLEEPVKGKSAIAIKEFNEFIRNRQDVDKVILTIRDGLYLIRKL
jgi:caffeoyl-CoA O-methyltransferase